MLTMSAAAACTTTNSGGGNSGTGEDGSTSPSPHHHHHHHHHMNHHHHHLNSYSMRSSDHGSVESEDSDNSSTNSGSAGSSSGGRPMSNNSSSSHLQPPIGCITTHRVSAVIRPERKMPPIDPLQFVKIQKNELSKKAVEQIKLAEEEKITKEKIKESEEEWQNNLMNWKSKRKLTKNNSEDEALPLNPNRKTKTFSEILNEKAKSGYRIGYNLHKYIDPDLENDDNLQFVTMSATDDRNENNGFQKTSSSSTKDYDGDVDDETSDSNNSSIQTTTITTHHKDDNTQKQRQQLNMATSDSSQPSTTNLDRFLKQGQDDTASDVVDSSAGSATRNGLGQMIVFNTSLLKEFSVKQQNDNNSELTCDNQINGSESDSNQSSLKQANNMMKSNEKVHVPINDWKSSHSPPQQQQSLDNEQQQQNDTQTHNSSFDMDEDDDLLDEEFEKLKLDQERSFKAKLHTFESLAKREEEAARLAAEANLKRQQNRQKLAAERSKSLSNINNQPQLKNNSKTNSNSASSSSLQQNKQLNKKESMADTYYQQLYKKSTSIVYNFKDKPSTGNGESDGSRGNSQSPKPTKTGATNNVEKSPQKSIQNSVKSKSPQPITSEPVTKSDHSERIETLSSMSNTALQHQSPPPPPPPPQQQHSMTVNQNNIYENVTSLTLQHHHNQLQQRQQSQQQPLTIMSDEASSFLVSDSDAIRNVSQKLLQQQQQIYQNQPIVKQQQPQSYHGYEHDSIGLPPIQITKTIQTTTPPIIVPGHGIHETDHHLYQNQMALQQQIPSGYHHHHPHSYDNGYPTPAEHPMLITREHVMPQYPLVSSNTSSYPSSQHHPVLVTPSPVESFPPPPPPPQPVKSHHHQSLPYISPPTNNNTNHQQYQQYIYYPQPYPGSNGNANGPTVPTTVTTGGPVIQSSPIHHSKSGSNSSSNNSRLPIAVPNPVANRYGSNEYNPNHWLIQEAGLRVAQQQQNNRIVQQQQQQQPPPPPTPIGSNIPVSNKSAGPPGYLSVSGKKKCSKCGDELGKGCAAMVVESLSLYYHINCFRCSVCDVQLGNGTVGTDVRVRNNKLHCQNCYSNDEAGLKFSRV